MSLKSAGGGAGKKTPFSISAFWSNVSATWSLNFSIGILDTSLD